MQTINFRRFPAELDNFSDLFLDYIDHFEAVAEYYAGDFHNIEALRAMLPRIAEFPRNREALVSVLLEQNASYGSSPIAIQNIHLLRRQNTFAIVTGQQVGFLGGPLYTLYKIITTLNLSTQLSHLFPEYRFVPIFWLEGEDHDFEEVSYIRTITKENGLLELQYLPHGKPLDRNPGAVGALQLTSAVEDFFQQVRQSLVSTEFSEPLFEALREIYQVGRSLNQAFVRFINYLFPDSGLVFVDPNNRELKELARRIFEEELMTFPNLCELVIDRSAHLEAVYHAQAKPKAINLFLFHKGGRYLIEPSESGFSLKGSRQKFTREEIMQVLNESIELLSPNVILRPIFQDWLLPTAMYVAGPSEIAYFAQLKPLYEHFRIPMPIIYPRASATILEEKIQKVLDRYSLSVLDFYGDIDELEQRILEQESNIHLDELFKEVKTKVGEALTELKFGLNHIDPTLLGALETTRSKIDTNLSSLREKAVAAQKRKNETLINQVRKSANHIIPDNQLQERWLSPLHFLNKYGFQFTHWLQSELRYNVFEHQILYLS